MGGSFEGAGQDTRLNRTNCRGQDTRLNRTNCRMTAELSWKKC
jgi:hypothetical protein